MVATSQRTPQTESMSNKLTVTLALAAGFLGGFASHYLAEARVYAQSPAVPEKIRAHEFVLVDEAGFVRGVFGIETNGAPEIEVGDPRHMMVYEAKGWGAVHGLMSGGITGPKKPTLLSTKP